MYVIRIVPPICIRIYIFNNDKTNNVIVFEILFCLRQLGPGNRFFLLNKIESPAFSVWLLSPPSPPDFL